MGSFFIDLLSFEHEVAVYEKDAKRMRFTYNCQRFTTLDEVKNFDPELVINAVTVKYTLPAFKEVLPYLIRSVLFPFRSRSVSDGRFRKPKSSFRGTLSDS